MTNIGVLMAGGSGKRQEHDFYPTPREATVALMEAFGDEIPARIWEPACGDGAISSVLEDYGRVVASTDLIDRGYGEGHGVNFLDCNNAWPHGIVTNPPFSLASAFIEKSHDVGAEWIAMLLKAQFPNAAGRIRLFKHYPPTIIAPLTWRLDFMNRGSPTMDCSWFIWNRQRTDTRFQLLRKPDLKRDVFA